MTHCNLQLDCSSSLFLNSMKIETEHKMKEYSEQFWGRLQTFCCPLPNSRLVPCVQDTIYLQFRKLQTKTRFNLYYAVPVLPFNMKFMCHNT